jgi:hypothetical protein
MNGKDVAGTIGLLFLLAIGVWGVLNPSGWIRYFLKSRVEISPDDRSVQSLVRFIGIGIVILSALGIVASLSIR